MTRFVPLTPPEVDDEVPRPVASVDNTETTKTVHTTAAEVEQKRVEDPGSDDPVTKLSGEDAPEPGSIYVINEADTARVITTEKGGILLTNFDGTPKKSQKWVCHRSGGWLGFTNDAGESTRYLGHDRFGTLICKATLHLPWEHFCVRKRAEKGFEIMVRHWFWMQPLGHKGGWMLGKRETSDGTWWGFTKVD